MKHTNILTTKDKQQEKTLRSKSLPVSVDQIKSEKVRKIVRELKHIMSTPEQGKITLGVAAPQIGELLQIIVVRFVLQVSSQGEILREQIVTMINPQVLSQEKETNTDFEGCLSVPNVEAKVSRSNKITVKYLDEQGESCFKELLVLDARVVLHEIDHLNGVLFTDLVENSILRRSNIF